MRADLLKNSLLTIIRREMTRIFRLWSQTLLPPVITQSLHFLIFGGFIGSRVGLVDGVPYIAFIVPGLVMMTVIQNSFMNVVSSFFLAKFQRSIEELIVSPTPDWAMMVGYVFGGIVRGAVSGVLVFAVCAVFAHPTIRHPFAILLFLFLAATLFSLAGFLNGIFAKTFDDISIFSTFVLVPLTYLGGVFYSLNQLPAFWQNVSRLNPILYMVDGFRYGFFGVASVPVWWSAVVLALIAVAITLVNLALLRRGVGMKQ